METCAPRSPPRRQREAHSAEDTRYFLPLVLITQFTLLAALLWPLPNLLASCRISQSGWIVFGGGGDQGLGDRCVGGGRTETGAQGILSPYLQIQQDSKFSTASVVIWASPELSRGLTERGWRGWVRPVGVLDTNAQKALKHAQQELGFWMPGGDVARVPQAGTKQGAVVGWWGSHGLEGGMGPQHKVWSGLCVGGPGGSHSSSLGRALSSPSSPPRPGGSRRVRPT